MRGTNLWGIKDGNGLDHTTEGVGTRHCARRYGHENFKGPVSESRIIRKTRCRGSLFLHEIHPFQAANQGNLDDASALQARKHKRSWSFATPPFLWLALLRQKGKCGHVLLACAPKSIVSVCRSSCVHPGRTSRTYCVPAPVVRVGVPCALGLKAASHGLRLTRSTRHSQMGTSKQFLGQFSTPDFGSRFLERLS